MADENRRDYYERRKGQMDTERSSFMPHWREISDYNQVRRGRFEKTDVNRGEKRHNNIINSTGIRASNTAQAGMFAGVMSPTRPWFDLATPDPGLMEFMPVKVWLRGVAKQMRAIFNSGNLYTMAPTMIGELLNFGTGCMTQVDDDDNLARFFTHTVGSYWISQNDQFVVDTLVREFMMTAEQMARSFTDGKDLSKLSTPVRTAIDRGNYDAKFPVVHFIEPNDDYRPDNPLAQNKEFASVKYETGNTDKDAYLSQSGFDEFPGYVPRWALTGEDIYGTNCPGMSSLGDNKQLQIEEKRKGQAIDKMVNPPLVGPASVRNTPITSLPGGLNIYSGDPSQTKLEPLYLVNISLQELKEDIAQVERRIENAYFVDLFLAISNMEGIQPRNQLELSERNAERLLQLGPVLERMQGDFLDKMISRTFNQMIRANVVPSPPPELEGQALKVEYISSLAQAQRAVDTRGIDRLTQYQGGLLSAGLSDGKKFNGDKAFEEYADLLGTPPGLIVSDEDVAQQRQAEQQQQAMAQNFEAANSAAQTAASAGQVDLEKDTPVSRALNAVGGQRG
tara:strand:- start:2214 stop:3905 length:1692 start_codon:yes stop_codon:yes gene_type:complete